jgi:hypothetical protein
MCPPRNRFEGAQPAELLQWAAAYLSGQADMIERSHKDEYGRIRPVETRVELKYIRDWLKRVAELEAPHRLAEVLKLARSSDAPNIPEIIPDQ